MQPIPKKAVTEADVRATEARLNESFARLKGSITRIPSDTVRPVTDTVKEHPYLTVAAAAGAGFLFYSLLSVITPRTKVIQREVTVQPQVEIKEHEKTSLGSKLLTKAVSLITPYVTSYVQGELARFMSKGEPQEQPEK